MGDVKGKIAQWRELNGKLRERNEVLDEVRKAAETLGSDHAQAMVQWDAQRSAMQLAINEGAAKVDEAAAAAEKALKEAGAAASKASERTQRNADHHQTLEARRVEVAAKKATYDANAAAAKERLEAFRAERARVKGQLEGGIQKFHALLEKERAAANAKSESLKRDMAALEAKAGAEAKAWATLVHERKMATEAAFLARVTGERAAAAASQAEFRGLLAQLPSVDLPAFIGDVDMVATQVRPRAVTAATA